MNDMVEAKHVDIAVDDTGKVWVNVDGVCVLRIGHAHTVVIDDPLRGQDIVWGED